MQNGGQNQGTVVWWGVNLSGVAVKSSFSLTGPCLMHDVTVDFVSRDDGVELSGTKCCWLSYGQHVFHFVFCTAAGL